MAPFRRSTIYGTPLGYASPAPMGGNLPRRNTYDTCVVPYGNCSYWLLPVTRRRTRTAQHSAGTKPSGHAGNAAARASATVSDTATDGEALRVTHWFEAGDVGERSTATVRFHGRLSDPSRADLSGRREFVQDESVAGIVPGSGPISVSTEVYGLAPGDWNVTAELLDEQRPAPATKARNPSRRQKTLPRAAWSWKSWKLASGPFEPVTTRWAPTVRLVAVPAVIPGSWIALVALGSVAGLGLQATLLARAGLPVLPALLLTTLAAVSGLIAAKGWYIAMHPRTWRKSPAEGWAVDGFLVVLPLVVIAGLVVLELPIGRFVDASTPGLFVGVAIGRLGCFFTGCCAGRFSGSRWSIWSSDRRIGGRRVPTQLLESAAGLLIALATLALVLGTRLPFDGLIFIAALAAYTFIRRILLPLRAARQPVSGKASPRSDRRRSALGARGLE